MKILMVADHQHSADQIKAAFADKDNELEFVSTPKRALSQLDNNNHYDLVVADNDTQPEGGMSLCREIKMRGMAGKEIPKVILLIAREQDAWLANWAQADAWVRKPVSPFDLLDVAQAVVAGTELPELAGVGSNPQPLAFQDGYRPEFERQLASRGWVPDSVEEMDLPVGAVPQAALKEGK